jgi:predicted GH43/DUF377 family glycosyl hydrolase
MDWLGITRRTVELDKSKLPPFDRHYNGALVRYGERLIVVLRCHNDRTAYDTDLWHPCKRSELWAVWLDEETLQPTSFRKLDIPLGNCEDPRCVVHDGKLHVFFTHFEQEHGNRYDPYVAVCNEQMDVVDLHRIGLFGRAETEKNWGFFIYEGCWHALYSYEPSWQIVAFDQHWRGFLIHQTKIDWGFRFGELRGGTPPVLVDGKYWSFFHSVWIHPDANRRIYSAGACCFGGKTPFAPEGVSTFPLITPDLSDCGWVRHGRIVFPCGAIFDERKREFIISYGYNDSTLRLDVIPMRKVVDPWLWRTVRPKMTVTMLGEG